MRAHLFRRPLRYRALALTATLAVAATLASLGAAQASAARAAPQSERLAARTATADTFEPESLSQCPQYSLCLWRNVGFGGTLWYWSNSQHAHNVWIYVGGGANDQASSLYNDRDDWSEVAKNYPANQPDINLESPGSYEGNLVALDWPDGSDMNDSISSIDLTTSS